MSVTGRGAAPQRDVRPEDVLVAGLGVLAAVIVLVDSLPRYAGRQGTLGPGAFPSWVALFLAICGASMLVKLARQGGLAPRAAWPRGAALRRVLLAAASLLVYQAVLQLLGFWLASALLLLFHLRALGHYRWRIAVPVAVLTALLVTYVFGTLLFLPLPPGLLGG